MKCKKINKKLSFNKNTVANLSQAAIQNVKGAGTGITCTVCNTDLSCIIYKCIVDFTNDITCLNSCTTCTRVDTCPVEVCI